MGKGGDKQIKKDETLEVLIDGRYYDVTNLKHPGGSVIKYYAGKGIDASQAFDNFHYRSKKAQKYLKSLPSREADKKLLNKSMLPGQADLLKDFDDFTKQLEAEGYFKPNLPHVLYRVSEIILMHALGIYLIYHHQLVFGLIVLGIAQGRCGWLMHEGGHYSLTGMFT